MCVCVNNCLNCVFVRVYNVTECACVLCCEFIGCATVREYNSECVGVCSMQLPVHTPNDLCS